MVKNNIEVDVKVKCIEVGKTQVQMMESLGYDIEITYVKRGVE